MARSQSQKQLEPVVLVRRNIAKREVRVQKAVDAPVVVLHFLTSL